MNIKLGNLTNTVNALGVIAEQKTSALFAWKLSKRVKVLADEAKAFETARIALCEKYADKDEEGKAVIVDDKFVGVDGNQEFMKELTDLANADVEFDIKPFDISELEVEGIKLSLQDVYGLGELIKGETSE